MVSSPSDRGVSSGGLSGNGFGFGGSGGVVSGELKGLRDELSGFREEVKKDLKVTSECPSFECISHQTF
jgi:hypothetical protein